MAKAAHTPRSSPRSGVWWALAGSVLIAVVYGWPALGTLTGAANGGDVDGYENIWNFWWVKTALFDLHRTVFSTDYLYYPTGISLRFHTLNPLNGLLTLPFNALLGYVATLNLFMVASLAATLFSAYLLVRYFVGDGWAAFAGAAAGTLATHVLPGIFAGGQTNLVSMQWLPLYLLFLFRSLHGPVFSRHAGPATVLRLWSGPRRLIDAGLAVAVLVLVSLVDWQYVMYCVFVTLLYAAYVLVAPGETWRVKWLLIARMAAVGAAYTAIVALPLVLPMLEEAQRSPWLSVSEQSGRHSVDLADLLGPTLANPGYLALALAAVGLLLAWRARRSEQGSSVWWATLFWAVAAAIFYTGSLGPRLIWAGTETSVPMPYALMQNLPVFSIGRDPGRFGIVATLAIGVLSGYGLAAISGRLRTRLTGRLRGPATGAVTLLFVAITLFGFVRETWATTRADPPEWPAFYEQIASDRAAYAVLDLPLFTEAGRGENHYMAYQVLHGKPRFGGRWARDHKLTNPNNFVKNSSLFRHLWLLNLSPEAVAQAFPPKDILRPTNYSEQGLAILNRLNVRYIVMYKDAIGPEVWARFEGIMKQVLGADAIPVSNDPKMVAYSVPATTLPDNPLTLDVGTGWYPTETRSDGVVYRYADRTNYEIAGNPLDQPAEIYSMNLTASPLTARLEFDIYTFQSPRTVRVLINGKTVDEVPLSVETNPKHVALDVTLEPGNNIIALDTPEPPLATGNPQDARLLSFGVYNVTLTAGGAR